jgi:dihydrofolate synthase / folylpolyglutamate synthase
MQTLIERYHDAVARLEGATIIKSDYMAATTPEAQQFFLDRGARFCDALGNPEQSFTYVHIAGTSGKGSTSTMIYNALADAQWNVGVYRSPYVTTAIENVEANGLLMDPESFIRLVDEILPVVAEIEARDPKWKPSYAEVFFGIALRYFQEQRVEWIVLETGCGGRFDKTNIVPAPVAIGLTPIGYDHTDILGDTLESIAWHKAGILKKGAAAFSSETKSEVRRVFDAQAKAVDTTIHYIEGGDRKWATGMPGQHQQMNAALASAICTEIGVPESAITSGIARTQLPARTELLQTNPRVLLDGAHSEPKMQALREVLETMRPWKTLHLVFAAKETKDPSAMITPIADLPASLTLTSFQLPGFGSYTPQAMSEYWQQQRPDLTAVLEPDALAATRQVLAHAEPDDLIVITGSLYLAGAVRELWISEEDILTERTVFVSSSSHPYPREKTQ